MKTQGNSKIHLILLLGLFNYIINKIEIQCRTYNTFFLLLSSKFDNFSSLESFLIILNFAYFLSLFSFALLFNLWFYIYKLY